MANLARPGEAGRLAADEILRRKIKLGFHRARTTIGAFWMPFGFIFLNTRHYSHENTLEDPYVYCLVLHETIHLQQGFFTAFSVYGELQAWQSHFRLFHTLVDKPVHPLIAELLSLPQDWDRGALRRARALMRAFAGKSYRVDYLPLYPLGRELLYYIGNRPALKEIV